MLFEYQVEAEAPRLVENETSEFSAPAWCCSLPLRLLLPILQLKEEQEGRISQR